MDFPDALIIGPVAGIQNHPVLLVTKDVVPTVTTRELERLSPSTITVIGGTESISDDVLARLRQLTSAEVERLPGSSRYETAAAVSSFGFPSGANVAFVANGDAYPDALTGAVAAAQESGPLLLVELDKIPEATATELERLHLDRIVILGGEGVVSARTEQALHAYATTVDRAWGWDRYETAVAISKAFFPDGASIVYIATGLNFPDALAGTPLAALRDGPILLVSNTVPSIILAEISRLAPTDIVILGGTGAVPLSVSYALAVYVN
jgi:putative cell wall-binding protein